MSCPSLDPHICIRETIDFLVNVLLKENLVPYNGGMEIRRGNFHKDWLGKCVIGEEHIAF